MSVLLVGAKGMLGSAVQRSAPDRLELVAVGHAELDITERQSVDVLLDRERPSLVINCAAYTEVDEAEAKPHDAYSVNTAGVVALARAARRVGAFMLHISSDYVFDGRKGAPYEEADSPNPLNVYGRTKLAGEQALRDILPDRHLILRTQWLFGSGGNNFLATMIHLTRTRPKVTVVNDQFGSPTYAKDLAAAIWNLVGRRASGTVHVTNSGAASWYQVACEVVSLSGVDAVVEPCTSSAMPRPARRPEYSVLNCARYESIAGEPLRDWKAAATEYVRAVLSRDHLPHS